MARPTNTDSRVNWLTLERRGLEVRGGWRALLAFIPAAIGAAIVTAGGIVSAVVGVVLFAAAVALLALPMFSPERVRRRLLADASDRVPDCDSWVTLVGIASQAGDTLAAPYSERRCIAYWARAVLGDPEDDSHDAGTDSEQWSAACDFALDVGGVRVLVTARNAYLAFDRSLGEVVDWNDGSLHVEPITPAHRGGDRHEEILLLPGERVVVQGMLVHGGSHAPYRAAMELVSARGRRVAIALSAMRHPKS